MARTFLAHCFALAALGVCIPSLPAQDHLLDDLYGRGVHAYFSRNYQDAHKLLSDAAASGSKDPRVFYFRALADNRLKRPDDAAADLKMATELEFSGEEPVQVSKALERIQGNERLMIESARSKARLTIRNAAEERAKIRYENRVKAEAAVLRKPPVAGVAPASAETPAAGTPDKTDPFGTGTPDAPPAAEKPAAPAAEKPAAPAEEKPAAPAKPAADDPFGDAPAKPAAPVAEKPDAPAAEKPAAPAKPAADDPFGDAPAKPAAPATEDKPAAEAPGEVKPASATEPATPGKGTILGSFGRIFSKAIPPVPAIPGIPVAKPPVVEAPIPKGDPNAPDPFGDPPPAKPAAPKAPGAPPAKPAAADPFAEDLPAKPAAPKPAAPAKPAPKAADEDPFK